MRNSIIQPQMFNLPPLNQKNIIIYRASFFYDFHKLIQGGKIKNFGPVKCFSVKINNQLITVLGGIIGAPLAILTLENAIASGGSDFITFGEIGWIGINPQKIGQLVTANAGYDQTTIAFDYGAESAKIMITPLSDTVKSYKLVTVNHLYGLTPDCLAKYRQQQIDLIDMESAPMSYVAQYYNCSLKSLFIVSDCVNANNFWEKNSADNNYCKAVEQGLNLLILNM